MPGSGRLDFKAPASDESSYRITEVEKSNEKKEKMHQVHLQAGAKQIVINLKVDDRRDKGEQMVRHCTPHSVA
jgi:hypothetical protein